MDEKIFRKRGFDNVETARKAGALGGRKKQLPKEEPYIFVLQLGEDEYYTGYSYFKKQFAAKVFLNRYNAITTFNRLLERFPEIKNLKIVAFERKADFQKQYKHNKLILENFKSLINLEPVASIYLPEHLGKYYHAYEVPTIVEPKPQKIIEGTVSSTTHLKNKLFKIYIIKKNEQYYLGWHNWGELDEARIYDNFHSVAKLHKKLSDSYPKEIIKVISFSKIIKDDFFENIDEKTIQNFGQVEAIINLSSKKEVSTLTPLKVEYEKIISKFNTGDVVSKQITKENAVYLILKNKDEYYLGWHNWGFKANSLFFCDLHSLQIVYKKLLKEVNPKENLRVIKYKVLEENPINKTIYKKFGDILVKMIDDNSKEETQNLFSSMRRYRKPNKINEAPLVSVFISTDITTDEGLLSAYNENNSITATIKKYQLNHEQRTKLIQLVKSAANPIIKKSLFSDFVFDSE